MPLSWKAKQAFTLLFSRAISAVEQHRDHDGGEEEDWSWDL
jgi:hypothetical protein